MLGLWTDSIVGAALILLTVGYGSQHWTRWGFVPGRVVAMGSMVIGLGVMVPPLGVDGGSLSLGFLTLGILVLGIGLIKGEAAWWLWWMSLATVMALVRILLPMHPYRAQLVATLGPESLVLGITGGILTQDPVAGIVVATGADVLSSVWIAFYRGGAWQLGYHDVTSALLAAVGGYAMGWIGYQWQHWSATA